MTKQAKANDFTILVNDARRLYAADKDRNGALPAGWKRVAAMQWEYVRVGYEYWPWVVGRTELTVDLEKSR